MKSSSNKARRCTIRVLDYALVRGIGSLDDALNVATNKRVSNAHDRCLFEHPDVSYLRDTWGQV